MELLERRKSISQDHRAKSVVTGRGHGGAPQRDSRELLLSLRDVSARAREKERPAPHWPPPVLAAGELQRRAARQVAGRENKAKRMHKAHLDCTDSYIFYMEHNFSGVPD